MLPWRIHYRWHVRSCLNHLVSFSPPGSELSTPRKHYIGCVICRQLWVDWNTPILKSSFVHQEENTAPEHSLRSPWHLPTNGLTTFSMTNTDVGAHPPHPLNTGAPLPLVLRAPFPLHALPSALCYALRSPSMRYVHPPTPSPPCRQAPTSPSCMGARPSGVRESGVRSGLCPQRHYLSAGARRNRGRLRAPSWGYRPTPRLWAPRVDRPPTKTPTHSPYPLALPEGELPHSAPPCATRSNRSATNCRLQAVVRHYGVCHGFVRGLKPTLCRVLGFLPLCCRNPKTLHPTADPSNPPPSPFAFRSWLRSNRCLAHLLVRPSQALA